MIVFLFYQQALRQLEYDLPVLASLISSGNRLAERGYGNVAFLLVDEKHSLHQVLPRLL